MNQREDVPTPSMVRDMANIPLRKRDGQPVGQLGIQLFQTSSQAQIAEAPRNINSRAASIVLHMSCSLVTVSG